MTLRYFAGLGVVLSLLNPVRDAGAAPVEWTTASGGNGHLYDAILVGSPITWEDAAAAAAALGPGWHLATATSAAENAFIESLFNADAGFFNCCLNPFPIGRISSGPWLGAFSSTNASNDWQWVTGEAFSFADWGPLEPFGNGDHISYAEFGAAQTLAWNDIASANPLSPIAYIAERSVEPIPEPGTLLLFMAGVGGQLARRRRAGRRTGQGCHASPR